MRMALRRWANFERRDSRRRNFCSGARRAAARKIMVKRRVVRRGCDERSVGTLGL
jgi:hypothetical protein